MPGILDNPLLDLVTTAERIFWGGSHPPLGRMAFSERIYAPQHDFRLPPGMHGSFQGVMLLERDLGQMKQWPMVLDEALRLLEPEGLLSLRFTSSPLMTIFELKHQLLAMSETRIKVLSEQKFSDGSFQSSFCLCRPATPRPALDSFSFGMLSDGRRPEAIEALVSSVHALDGLDRIRYEILVCGPPSLGPAIDAMGPAVRLVPQPDDFADLGWISHKKNLLVQASDHENVLIMHDRYVLAQDFLTRLEAYGADFSVLVCRQETTDGLRFPDWVTLGSAWSSTSSGTLPYGDYCRNLYVNGGMMLAKRAVLARVGWNELLFWMQAEDVEISRRMQAHGIVPRLARDVRVLSTTFRNDYLDDFELLPTAPRHYLMTNDVAQRGEMAAPEYIVGTAVRFAADPLADALRQGVRLDAAWQAAPAALRWAGPGHVEIGVRLHDEPPGDLEVVLDLEYSHDVRLTVGNAPLQPWQDSQGRTRAKVAAALRSRPIMRLRLYCDGDICLRQFVLQRDRGALPAPVKDATFAFRAGSDGVALLGSGWSQPEDWGSWSIAEIADLVLPSCPIPPEGLSLRIFANAYAPLPRLARVFGLSANAVPFGFVTLPGDGSPAWVTFTIPAALLNPAGSNRLALHSHQPVSPASLGLSVDSRLLGIGLRKLATGCADHR